MGQPCKFGFFLFRYGITRRWAMGAGDSEQEGRAAPPGLRHKLLALCQKANSGIWCTWQKEYGICCMIRVAKVYTCTALQGN